MSRRCPCNGANDTCPSCWGTGVVSGSKKNKALRLPQNPWESNSEPYTIPKPKDQKFSWVDFFYKNRLTPKLPENPVKYRKFNEDSSVWSKSKLVQNKDKKSSRVKAIKKIRNKKKNEADREDNMRSIDRFRKSIAKYASNKTQQE